MTHTWKFWQNWYIYSVLEDFGASVLESLQFPTCLFETTTNTIQRFQVLDPQCRIVVRILAVLAVPVLILPLPGSVCPPPALFCPFPILVLSFPKHLLPLLLTYLLWWSAGNTIGTVGQEEAGLLLVHCIVHWRSAYSNWHSLLYTTQHGAVSDPRTGGKFNQHLDRLISMAFELMQ